MSAAVSEQFCVVYYYALDHLSKQFTLTNITVICFVDSSQVGKPEGNRPLGRVVEGESVILKWLLKN